jgi:steroid 5-alpha reductase family enzyme
MLDITPTSLPTISLLAIASCMLVLWLVSIVIKDVSIIDAFWGTAFVLVSWIGLVVGHGVYFRKILLVLLVSIWGIRLSIYLFFRNHGKPEDYRYAAMRKRDPNFTITSLYKVFGVQGLVVMLLSPPLWKVLQTHEPTTITVFDIVGTLVWLFGFLFESIGDYHLSQFKKDKNNAGKLMNKGLWRYTRHPNYFGDAVQWWGYGIIALSIPGAWWTLYSPALMTYVLVRVTGASLLEKKLAKTKPEWSKYMETTNTFIPWFPSE